MFGAYLLCFIYLCSVVRLASDLLALLVIVAPVVYMSVRVSLSDLSHEQYIRELLCMAGFIFFDAAFLLVGGHHSEVQRRVAFATMRPRSNGLPTSSWSASARQTLRSPMPSSP